MAVIYERDGNLDLLVTTNTAAARARKITRFKYALNHRLCKSRDVLRRSNVARKEVKVKIVFNGDDNFGDCAK